MKWFTALLLGVLLFTVPSSAGDLFFTYYNTWCMGYDNAWNLNTAYYISTKTFAKNIGNITHVIIFEGYEIVRGDFPPYFSITKEYADNGGGSHDSLNFLWNASGNPNGGMPDWVARGGIEALRDSLHAKGKFILVDLQAVNASMGLNAIVADSAKTEVFSKAVWGYLVRHNFDGADLNVENSQTYTRDQFLRFHRIMARNKPAGKIYTVVPPIYDQDSYAGAQQYIDYVLPQCYAYVSNWQGNDNRNGVFLKAPLHLNTIPPNANHQSIATENPYGMSLPVWGPKRWNDAGWPKSKIVILLSNEANPFMGSDQLFSSAGWNTPFWPDTAAVAMLSRGGTLKWSTDVGNYVSGTATASLSSNGTTISSGSQFIVPYLSDRNIDSVVAWGKANGYNNYGLYDVSTDARTPAAVKMPRHDHLGSLLAGGVPPPPPPPPPPTPVLTVSTSSLAFGDVTVGQTSASKTFTFNGSNLTGAVSVSVSGQFTISSNNTSFSSNLTFSGASGTVYARFLPSATGTQSSVVSVSSSGVTPQYVSLSGNGVAVPPPPPPSTNCDSAYNAGVLYGLSHAPRNPDSLAIFLVGKQEGLSLCVPNRDSSVIFAAGVREGLSKCVPSTHDTIRVYTQVGGLFVPGKTYVRVDTTVPAAGWIPPAGAVVVWSNTTVNSLGKTRTIYWMPLN